jgi:hypothetical protein
MEGASQNFHDTHLLWHLCEVTCPHDLETFATESFCPFIINGHLSQELARREQDYFKLLKWDIMTVRADSGPWHDSSVLPQRTLDPSTPLSRSQFSHTGARCII